MDYKKEIINILNEEAVLLDAGFGFTAITDDEHAKIAERIVKLFAIPVVVESLRDKMATRFAQTALQTWDSELSNKHREDILEDWINRNGEGLTIQANIAKDAYSLADEMLKHR